MKFTWGKPMIHVEQKNPQKKNGIRSLAKATKENRKALNKQRRKQKNSDVKEIRLPIKKTKKLLLLYVLLRFWLVFYEF